MPAAFDYIYPEHLVALKPQEPCRILNADTCTEIKKEDLLALFAPGDLLIVNNSKVEKRRIITADGLEILFLAETSAGVWEVLFPARGLKVGAQIALPGGRSAKLIEKGIPQRLQVDQKLAPSYFTEFGELALPPYIQAARGDRHNWSEDEAWYQTAWASQSGSVASPTASLHFTKADLEKIKKIRGVDIVEVTLHVGAGTFLPIRSENLEEHIMHKEEAEISASAVAKLKAAKSSGHRIWALGTTACRTVESWAADLLPYVEGEKVYRGETDLFIYPSYEWKYVNGLLTNFHQPKTTLLALVESFAGRERLEQAYQFAIAKEFRLFSYGDLSVWTRE